jgi:hypothetical protein
MQFKQFWPVYLHAHSRRSTRALHYAATGFFGFMAAIAVAVEEIWVVPAGIAGSYAVAVTAHWCFERNRPLFLVNPLWGAVADLRMCWLALTGRLRRELTKCQVPGYESRSLDRPELPVGKGGRVGDSIRDAGSVRTAGPARSPSR